MDSCLCSRSTLVYVFAFVGQPGESDLSNGYLDTPIDWIPGMSNMRLRDFPSFVRTTNPNDVLFNFTKDEAQDCLKATAIVVHTFEDLEGPVLDAMSAVLPPVYAIGPLNLMCRQMLSESVENIGSNFWKDDSTCLKWLEGRASRSVLYISFGSLAVMTRQQLIEFAWGFANSGHDFLWVIRPDCVIGDSAILPEEFLSEISERGLLISWCPQEEVLMHPSIGGFLTHCGWNSLFESISWGVPTICWPCFAEQPTNCKYACNEFRIGLEISNDVKREEVEVVVKELLREEKGIEMRRMALKWKERAINAIKPDGKSFVNLEKVIEEVLLRKK